MNGVTGVNRSRSHDKLRSDFPAEGEMVPDSPSRSKGEDTDL